MEWPAMATYQLVIAWWGFWVSGVSKNSEVFKSQQFPTENNERPFEKCIGWSPDFEKNPGIYLY